MFAALLLALPAPPHGRVNHNCFTIWNGDRSNLDVVWSGAVFQQPWQFRDDTDSNEDFCGKDTCTQRLWCTDSGVVGWYNSQPASMALLFAWLLNLKTGGKMTLSVDSHEGKTPQAVDYTTQSAAGPLVVIGNTLYFYTRGDPSKPSHYAYPRLSTIVFEEYRDGAKPSEMMHWGVRGFNIIGYQRKAESSEAAFPIYPVGSGIVTVSVSGISHEHSIDTVIRVNEKTLSRVAQVHYKALRTPSSSLLSREVLTAPGYACRAFTTGQNPLCYHISEGRFTWSSRRKDVLGMTFHPMKDSFELPSGTWLHDSADVNYRALVGSGFGSPVAFTDSGIYLVMRAEDASCPSGHRLVLSLRDTNAAKETKRTPLNCESTQVFQRTSKYEPSYASTAVKWLGPWAEGFVLLTAESVDDNEYYLMGTPSEYQGNPGMQHLSLGVQQMAIQVPTQQSPLSCPMPQGAQSQEWDLVVAAQAAMEGRLDCLSQMILQNRVPVDALYQGIPLIALSVTSDVAIFLIQNGANPEAKGIDGRTALTTVVMSGNNPGPLLDHGVAVCTLPLNVFIPGFLAGNRTEEMMLLNQASLILPCEPGYYMTPGENCSGLMQCSEGHYCPGYLQRTNAIYTCPEGTYAPDVGLVDITQCRLCPPDRPYSPPGSADESACSSEYAISTTSAVDQQMTTQITPPAPVPQPEILSDTSEPRRRKIGW